MKIGVGIDDSLNEAGFSKRSTDIEVFFSIKNDIGACCGHGGSAWLVMRSKWRFRADASMRLIFLFFCSLILFLAFWKRGQVE